MVKQIFKLVARKYNDFRFRRLQKKAIAFVKNAPFPEISEQFTYPTIVFVELTLPPIYEMQGYDAANDAVLEYYDRLIEHFKP